MYTQRRHYDNAVAVAFAVLVPLKPVLPMDVVASPQEDSAPHFDNLHAHNGGRR